MTTMRAGAFCCLFGLLAAGIAPQQAGAADAGPFLRQAKFEHERASSDARQVADWVLDVGDNQAGEERNLPFAILDKRDARVYVFDADGRLRGAAPALLGMGIGDTALPGIGARELSNIPPRDRITQAGRFVAWIGADNHGEDVLWLDYDGGLAMHRVITSDPKQRRLQRLATPTPLDNRISWGCINLPMKFYEQVVQPAFRDTKGIVYVLPETRPALKFFVDLGAEERSRKLFALQPDSQLGAGGN
jgi:hypothetical protein